MIPKHQQINVWMNMSETPEKKKARLRYDNAFKRAWTDEFHFIKHSRKVPVNKFAFCEFCRTATECTVLHPSEKKSFFPGFIILYLKFWLHRFYIQNAAFCILLKKKTSHSNFYIFFLRLPKCKVLSVSIIRTTFLLPFMGYFCWISNVFSQDLESLSMNLRSSSMQ